MHQARTYSFATTLQLILSCLVPLTMYEVIVLRTQEEAEAKAREGDGLMAGDD